MTFSNMKKKNTFPLYGVSDSEFLRFGRILEGVDASDALRYLESNTEIPDGGVYVASDMNLEQLDLSGLLADSVFGNMPIEIGYCNGRNSMLNALEYHKGSEVDISADDIVLLLASVRDIRDNCLSTETVSGFYLPRGVAVELFSDTLHFSPCRTGEKGYRTLVALPAGTNLPLECEKSKKGEAALLFAKNKWLIAHPDCERLKSRGAYQGLTGANLSVIY